MPHLCCPSVPVCDLHAPSSFRDLSPSIREEGPYLLSRSTSPHVRRSFPVSRYASLTPSGSLVFASVPIARSPFLYGAQPFPPPPGGAPPLAGRCKSVLTMAAFQLPHCLGLHPSALPQTSHLRCLHSAHLPAFPPTIIWRLKTAALNSTHGLGVGWLLHHPLCWLVGWLTIR